MSRIVRSLAAVAALTAMSAPAIAVGAADAAPATVQRADKIKREIELTGKEPKPNRFFLVGRVTPTDGKKAKAVIQRKNCKSSKCSWYGYEKFTTGKSGRFKERVAGPARGQSRVYYRVKVKATDKYTGVTSQALYIYRL